VLHDEAAALLGQADRIPGRVTAASGAANLAIGTLADTAEHSSRRVVPLLSSSAVSMDVNIC
jgi:hypothetical protein